MNSNEGTSGKHRTVMVRLLAVVAVLAGLVALACAGAEPTATTAPTAGEPVATATTAPVEEDAGRDVSVLAAVRPEITAEIIERLDTMTVKDLLATFPASYPAEYAPGDIKPGGVLRHAANFDFARFDPRISSSKDTATPVNMVYDNLIMFEQGPGRDPDNPAIVSNMAESWEFSEDGTRLTFQLREGIYWGDTEDPFQKGPEVVAEDIAFILTEYRDNSIQGGSYRTMESVEAPSRYTVVLTFSSPSFHMLEFMASKDGTMFNPYLASEGRMNREMVGPGPFILVEAKKSISLRYVRNPNHFMEDQWGNSLPYLDGVDMLITPDEATRLAMLRTGRVEHAENIASNLRGVQTLLKSNPEIQVHGNPGGGGGTALSFQMNDPLMQDINVRRALTLAVDQKGISQVIYQHLGMPVDPKFEWWFWTDTAPSWEDDLDALYGPYQNHFDLEQAKDMWAQAGVGDLSLTIPYFPYTQAYTDTAALVAGDLSQLGIDVKINSLDYATYSTRLNKRDYDQVLQSWQQAGYGAAGRALTRLYGGSPANRENINDPIIDDLVDQLSRTGDQVEQRDLVTQIRAQYNEQVYWVPTASGAVGFSTQLQPYVRGIRSGQFSSLNAWYAGYVYRYAWLDK